MTILARLDLQTVTYFRDESGWSPYESLLATKAWRLELDADRRIIHVSSTRARQPETTVVPFENVKGWVVAPAPAKKVA